MVEVLGYSHAMVVIGYSGPIRVYWPVDFVGKVPVVRLVSPLSVMLSVLSFLQLFERLRACGGSLVRSGGCW